MDRHETSKGARGEGDSREKREMRVVAWRGGDDDGDRLRLAGEARLARRLTIGPTLGIKSIENASNRLAPSIAQPRHSTLHSCPPSPPLHHRAETFILGCAQQR